MLKLHRQLADQLLQAQHLKGYCSRDLSARLFAHRELVHDGAGQLPHMGFRKQGAGRCKHDSTDLERCRQLLTYLVRYWET